MGCNLESYVNMNKEEWYKSVFTWVCTYRIFQAKECKYTKVSKGWDGMEVISMIVLVLVKKDIMKYVHDMKTVEEWDMVSQMYWCTVWS